MKDLFAWVDKTDAIVAIALATLILAFIILSILVSRSGRSAETSATIREIRKVGNQVENMRSQNTNEHAPMQDYVMWIHRKVRLICERLGFLDDKNMSEPPLPPTVKPKSDDTN